MLPPVSDEQLFSWVERGAAGLDDYLRDHPEAAERVAAWRATLAGARVALSPPADIAGLRVVRLIGRGGMGVVYEAEQELPKRRVALKLLPGAIDPAGLARFERECAALGRLVHANIAQLHQAGRTEGGEPFLVMELVEGPALSERMSDVSWTRAQRLAFFAELCDAIAFAHAAGVVHRDLKPGNVLIDAQGRPKVVDFGLALLRSGDASRVTQPGAALGTLAYASPEQLSGRDVDARADVWSLGVLLHELLTGRRPFLAAERDLPALVHAIAHDEVGLPSRFDRTLRGDLDAIVLRAMQREPARRYADAKELGADVRRHLAGTPTEARPPTAARRIARFVARHRQLVAAAFLLIAAAASALQAFGTWKFGARGADFSQPLVGSGYAELAPYSGLRWRGTTPEVEVGGKYYELVAIDDLRADLIVAFCRQTAKDRWVKRFSEDLGQVLERMTGRPVPARVKLTVKDLASGEQVELRDVAMTNENRQALWRARHGRLFETRSGDGGRVEVKVSGAWHELVSMDGVDAATLESTAREKLGADLAAAFEQGFSSVFEELFDRPMPSPMELVLRPLDGSGNTTEDGLITIDVAKLIVEPPP